MSLLADGEVAERLNAPVLKTGNPARGSGVRISPSPPVKESDKPEPPVHTLNRSGVAVGRALIAVIENCQQLDGTIAPQPLPILST